MMFTDLSGLEIFAVLIRVSTIRNLDNMAYITELAKALKQEDQETRVRILRAFEELEDPRATPFLLEALDDSCTEVRRAAIRALSWIGDERARPSFLEALRDHDFSYRLWAAIGL